MLQTFSYVISTILKPEDDVTSLVKIHREYVAVTHSLHTKFDFFKELILLVDTSSSFSDFS